MREYGSALCAGSIDTRLSAAVMAQRRVELKLTHAPLPTATRLVYDDVADDNDDNDNNDDEQMRDEDVCWRSAVRAGTRVAADAPTRSPIARYSTRYVHELMADIEMLSIRGSTWYDTRRVRCIVCVF